MKTLRELTKRNAPAVAQEPLYILRYPKLGFDYRPDPASRDIEQSS
jgi:hypothetical protein